MILNVDPTSEVSKAYIMYHPLIGHCVQVNDKNELEIGSLVQSQEGLSPNENLKRYISPL